MLAPYYDKLFIIKNRDDIKTYDGDEYYDMGDLLERRKIRKRLAINRYMNYYLFIVYLSLIWLIFCIANNLFITPTRI